MKKLFISAIFFGIGCSLLAQNENIKTNQELYEWRIKQSYLNGTYIPKDLTDAFVQLHTLIDKASKEKFKNAPEDIVTKKLHFTLGRWIMVNWGFYEGSRLSAFLNEIQLYHPDDMARFLIITYHRSLNRKPLNVKDLVIALKRKRKMIEKERLLKGETLHEEILVRERPDSLRTKQ